MASSTQPKSLSVERMAGRRCDFVVYYTRGGVKYLDAMWGADEETVRRDFLAMCEEIRWTNVEIDRIEPRAAE